MQMWMTIVKDRVSSVWAVVRCDLHWCMPVVHWCDCTSVVASLAGIASYAAQRDSSYSLSVSVCRRSAISCFSSVSITQQCYS